jgi:hypothetical protein
MKRVLAAWLAMSGVAAADGQVVVVPPPVQPEVKVQPAFPVVFQDLTVGYRHEELPGMSADGFALRAVYGVPGLPLDGEGEMAGAWGYQGANLVGHAQISMGLRLVTNKPGHVRPFLVAAPLVEITRVGSDEAYAVGANGGVGVDLLLPSPGLVSIDVRGGQTMDLHNSMWSGWQVLATVSIGLHVEPGGS